MNRLKNMEKRIREKLIQFEIKHKIEFLFGIILVVISIFMFMFGLKNAMAGTEIGETKSIFETGIMFLTAVSGASSIDESIEKKKK